MEIFHYPNMLVQSFCQQTLQKSARMGRNVVVSIYLIILHGG